MNHNINHLQKMKRTFLYSSLFGVGMLFAACAEKSRPDLTLPCQNTIAIESTDTPESIMEKAAHIVPSPMQMEALKNEFIAFIHFGPNTFTRMEWGNGMEDPRVFDLKQLDTDQWCEAMKAAGMKMVIFTAKLQFDIRPKPLLPVTVSCPQISAKARGIY